MSRLIETIRYEDGKFFNLRYHERRMARAFSELFGNAFSVSLSDQLMTTTRPDKGLFKCRVVYDETDLSTEFVPYIQREVRSLKIVDDNSMTYDHKFEDRSVLVNAFAKRGACDDVLIIKNGWVTDTSQANIVFRKGARWISPSTLLLPGTMREYLIDQRRLSVEDIRKEDIRKFDSFKLINAMVQFDSDELSIDKIVF